MGKVAKVAALHHLWTNQRGRSHGMIARKKWRSRLLVAYWLGGMPKLSDCPET